MRRKPSRRQLLASAAGGVGATAGCFGFWTDDCERPEGDSALDRAIYASRRYLLDGPLDVGTYWRSPVAEYGDRADVQLTTYFALTLDHLGIDPASRDAAVRYVRAARPDAGAWDDPATNYAVRLLFERVGPDADADAIADIDRALDAASASLVDGGELDTGDVSLGPFSPLLQTKLFYAAMSDRYEPDELFDWGQFEGLFDVLQATPALRDGIDPTKPLAHPAVVDQLLSFLLLGAALTDTSLDGLTDDTEREETGTDALEALLTGRRLMNGAWAGANSSTFAALALYEHGRAPTEPAVERPLSWIAAERQAEDGRVIVFQLPVWDTILAMRALTTAGIERDNPVLRRAAQWLLDARTTTPTRTPLPTELDRPPLPFRRHSLDGWGYFPYNVSDWDDTALALGVLHPYGAELTDPHVEFLLDVQNADGSWSAFVTDFDPLPEAERRSAREALGESTYNLLFRNHPSPDVTGHALEALGKLGFSLDDDPVADAIDYLRRAQAHNGLWLGVWGSGYTYGTNCAVVGLDAVGVNMDREFVQAAVETLLAEQNADGGWGDASAYSLTDERIPYAGAASEPVHTGWCVQTLLTAGVDPESTVVREAVDYLLRSQHEDGSWDPGKVGYNLGPPRYQSSMTSQAAVLRGLAMYAEATGMTLEPRC